MPYISGARKGEPNRSDLKKLWEEKVGESPPVSWNRDKIMNELEKKAPKKVEVKEEPEVIEVVNHVMETVESVQPKKRGRKKKN